MSLKHHSHRRALPNEAEELYNIGHDIIMPSMIELLNKGWDADRRGRSECAEKYYQGANYYIYLFHYALIIRNYLDREGLLDKKCISLDIECKFKIECVEKNLPCLGTFYGTDFLKAWNLLREAYGIDRQTQECEDECCVGISEMIINDPDDCIAFILGECNENQPPQPPYGEFAVCEYTSEEHTEPQGEDLYETCDT